MNLKVGMLLSVCFFSFPIFSQTVNIPQEQANTFIGYISEKKINEAFTNLFSGTILQKYNGSAITEQEKQTSEYFKNLGRLNGNDLISEKKYGDSIVKLIYLIKTERAPLFISLFFYKYDQKWEILSMNLKTDLSLLN